MAGAGAGRRAWARAAAALVAIAAVAVGATAGAAAAGSPVLRLVVEPPHPVAGAAAEVVAQVVPSSLARRARVQAVAVDPGGRRQAVPLSPVAGAAPGTWSGFVPVRRTGRWRVEMRLVSGKNVLTADQGFTVVTGSLIGHDLSLAVMVVVLGGAWYLMRRRR
ncbi:MAG: hypothetical protein K6V73_05180 [Firmicutes bacterium]|nr:hypothetical protein [Bacillota bacterium]